MRISRGWRWTPAAPRHCGSSHNRKVGKANGRAHARPLACPPFARSGNEDGGHGASAPLPTLRRRLPEQIEERVGLLLRLRLRPRLFLDLLLRWELLRTRRGLLRRRALLRDRRRRRLRRIGL